MADYRGRNDAEADLLSDVDHSSSASVGTSGDDDDMDDMDDDDDDDLPPAPPPPVSQNFFAPPFYGRPPTPLPPSPSLTSLLRPSRPTTPDASGDEGEGGHHHHHYHDGVAAGPAGFFSSSSSSLPREPRLFGGGSRSGSSHQLRQAQSQTSLLSRSQHQPYQQQQHQQLQHQHSAHQQQLLHPDRVVTGRQSHEDLQLQATTVRRAAPKVPTYEYYGFVLYVLSTLMFGIYVLWAYLPSPFLHALGIFYYPNRWWALAVPAWLVMLIVYIYVALAAYNTEYLTLPLSSLETVVDDAANIAPVVFPGEDAGEDSEDEADEADEKEDADEDEDTDGEEGHGGREKGDGKFLSVGQAEKTDGSAGKKGRGPQQNRPASSGRQGNTGKLAPTDNQQQQRRRQVSEARAEKIDWRAVWNRGTDAVMDVPLAGVNEVLYGYYDDDDETEVF